jgi:hypothetical protein
MAESTFAKGHGVKCGHAACSCVLEPSQSYCSDWCASASAAVGSAELPGEPRGGPCQCGHPDCGHALK